MNYRTIKQSLFTILLLTMASCTNLNEIKPLNQLTEDNVVRDETSANALLNRVYNSTRSFDITDFSVVLGYYGVEQDLVRGVYRGGNNYASNAVEDDNGLLENYYTGRYATINNANFLIDQLEKGNAKGISEKRKNGMLSQAKTLRALSHFNLLRVFGQFYDINSTYGIVLSTQPFRGKAELPRNSVKECYQGIISDLKFATANGPTGLQHCYFNRTASQALLAKVQLYMGDYTQAATNALAVINNTNGFKLATSYAAIFKDRWNSEEVLYAPFVDGFNEGDASTGSSFGSRTALPSTFFKTLADDSDGIPKNGDAIKKASGYDARFIYAYSTAPTTGNPTGTSGVNGNGKYIYQSYDPNGTQGNTYYYLRMAEVYLIYAEAEVRRGGDVNDALAKLNTVRNRVKMPLKSHTDKATLLTDIRNEKMLELFTETGEPWFDLVRYDILADVSATSLKSTLSNKNKFIFPIPAKALAGNKLLVLNP